MRVARRTLLAVAFITVAGCAAPPPQAYPPGPYGFDERATIPDLTFDSLDEAGTPSTVRLRDYYEPNAPTSRLLLLRVGAGWCGTCRWHLQHTRELFSLGIGSSLSLVDLTVADDDNVPARPEDVPAYRTRIDSPRAVAIDPEFRLLATMFVSGALPLFVIIDQRTMRIEGTLNNPDPDRLEARLISMLNRLNKTALEPGPSTDGPDGFQRNEWDMIREMALPGAPPPDPTNAKADDPAAAALGRALFSDASLSPTGTVSCATCHDPARSFTDGKPQSVGVAAGDRNAPSVLFASHARWQFWDGRADSLWAQALGPLENPKEIDSSRLYVAHALFDRYRAEYEAIFGAMPALNETARFPASGKPGSVAWQAMAQDDQQAVTRVFVNAGKAIAAFERTLRSQPNAFDRFIAGEPNALTLDQRESLKSYFVIGCPQCHYGPRLTDDAFHTLRFPTGRVDGVADRGRELGIAQLVSSEFLGTGPFSDAPMSARDVTSLTATPNTVGAFKTPSLRGIASTAPYGHGGSVATLLDVAKLYGVAGVKIDDSRAVGTSEPWLALFIESHAGDLVPFLEVLTAEPAP